MYLLKDSFTTNIFIECLLCSGHSVRLKRCLESPEAMQPSNEKGGQKKDDDVEGFLVGPEEMAALQELLAMVFSIIH